MDEAQIKALISVFGIPPVVSLHIPPPFTPPPGSSSSLARDSQHTHPARVATCGATNRSCGSTPQASERAAMGGKSSKATPAPPPSSSRLQQGLFEGWRWFTVTKGCIQSLLYHKLLYSILATDLCSILAQEIILIFKCVATRNCVL